MRAHLDELRLELLAAGDVDEHAVEEPLASHRVGDDVARVEHPAHFAVRPPDLELEIAHATVALQQTHLELALLRLDEQVVCAEPRDVLQRFDADRLEERGVRVENLALRRRDVDPFTEVLRELAETFRIREAAIA